MDGLDQHPDGTASAYIGMHLVRMQEAERDPDAIEQARLEIISRLELLDRHLSRRAYIAGDTFTVGDIAPACAAYRWTLFDLPGPKMRNLSEWQSRSGNAQGSNAILRRARSPPVNRVSIALS